MSAQRLPIPGGDSGSWGDILNAYLAVVHNTDGTLANNVVGTAQIQDGAVTNTKLDSATQSAITKANSALQSSQLGAASGVATLDGTGNVPSSQLSNATGSSVPTPSATNQTIVSNGSNVWTLTPAATLDTTDTPQPDTVLGNPGTGPKAATANHSHPLNTLGRSMFFGGYPPSLSDNTDFTFDGTWNGTIPSSGTFGGLTGFSNNGNPNTFASLSGSTYTMASIITQARNITVNAGITLKPSFTSGGILLFASESITINGTINCSGANAVGATGGGGAGAQVNKYQGCAGATGGTGAGTAVNGSNNSIATVGGSGGNGGAAGATAGGSGYPQAPSWLGPMPAFLYLLGGYQNGNTVPTYLSGGPPMGGLGGGSGAGDGMNAGGGSGSGGGVLILAAPQITIGATAVLNVNGGNGANGVAGNAGGGGGGGSGLAAIHGLAISIASGAVIQNQGGSAGAGVGTGNAGTAGTQTGIFQDPPTGAGGFGFGNGVLICKWQ